MEEASLISMATELVTSTSSALDFWKKHPIIELAKVTLAVLGLRLDLVRTDPSSSPHSYPRFARRHPFVAWLSSFATGYAGSILACLLVGESILKPLTNPTSLLNATVAFLLVFHSPFDIAGRLLLLPPTRLVLGIAAEIYRVGNIVSGVNYAARTSLGRSASFPAPYLVAVGVAKGAGSSLLLPVIRLLRTGGSGGVAFSASNEILLPSLFVKASFWASTMATLHALRLLPVGLEFPALHVFLHAFFVLLRLAATLGGGVDPFVVVETAFGAALAAASLRLFEGEGEEGRKEGEREGGGEGGEERRGKEGYSSGENDKSKWKGKKKSKKED